MRTKQTKLRVVNALQQGEQKHLSTALKRQTHLIFILLYDNTSNDIILVFVDYNFINLNMFSYFIDRQLFSKEESKGKMQKE